MARTSERGGPQTRSKIAEVAARLFIDRGYDEVTVAEVAREAGVSSVTVFIRPFGPVSCTLSPRRNAPLCLRCAIRLRSLVW